MGYWNAKSLLIYRVSPILTSQMNSLRILAKNTQLQKDEMKGEIMLGKGIMKVLPPRY